jgi:shikimate kinase/3-dehydroquinate synthase
MPELGTGLVLVGLPGSGKSTVGRLVARRLGRPFVDTDELIARRTGVPASEYLRTRGEDAFRAAEHDAVSEACAEPSAVVAPGAGALSDPLDRWRLSAHGRVVWLRAPEETLLERLAADGTPRPLLDDAPRERLAELAERRAPFYRAADAELDAGLPAERVADSVADLADGPPPGRRRLFDSEEPRHHPIGPEHARIVFGHRLGPGLLGELLDEIGGTARLVADRRALAGDRVLSDPAGIAAEGTAGESGHPADLAATFPAERRLVLNGGEQTKRLLALGRILEWLASNGAERGDPVVVLGGGTVLDVGGLAAALHGRGTPFVAVPTTWLAQADAAFGGKVAIDLPAAKNGVGAFWPPWAVLADTAALVTLPLARRRDGLAEAVKSAIIGDPALWSLIAERGRAALRGTDEAARYAITERAARVKLAIVRRDPFEACERRQLNLGHTLGHALEVESGYRLAHGAAVALGMRAATAIADGRGADQALPGALDDLLASLGFPLHRAFDAARVRAALGSDKKRRAGRQRWILPMAVGQVVEVDDVSEAELSRGMKAVSADG